MRRSGENSNTTAFVHSLRDPDGSVFRIGPRILRAVRASGLEGLTAFLGSPIAQELIETGHVVRSEILSHDRKRELLASADLSSLPLDLGNDVAVVEHERVGFPSYPYEWPPEMLHAAGLLTLHLARQILAAGFGLKDATPYNVLFRGTEPVHVDVLSFERRDPGDPQWLPYAQFLRTFVLPLLANRLFGLSLDQLLLTRRDGLEPEEVYRWASPIQRLRPPLLTLSSIPTWLAASRDPDNDAIYRELSYKDPERARYVLVSLLNRLGRTLDRLSPRTRKVSVWVDYMSGNNNYSVEHFARKDSFVQKVFDEFRPLRVLDVGCNVGHFSIAAAKAGAQVVAVDSDPGVVGNLWQSAHAQGLNILPLVVNVARPSPGVGWENQECYSFLDRAHQRFDTVLMLAVLHHLLVTEGIPLSKIMELAGSLTTNLLVIELVGPEDSMFRRLTRGRERLYQDLTPEHFEHVSRKWFTVIRSQHFENSARWMYLLRKTDGC